MPDKNEHDLSLSYLYGFLGVAGFSLTLPMTQIAIRDFDAVFVGLGRAIPAAAVAAFLLVIHRAPFPPRSMWLPLVITSAGIVIGFPLFAVISMQYASAAHGGVIIAIAPLLTAVFGVVFAKERPSAAFWIFALAGSACVLTFAVIESQSVDLQWGTIWMLVAAVCASIGYAQGGVLSRTLGGWQTICWCLLFSLPVICLMVFFFAEPVNWNASLPSWVSFVYLALVSQLLAFFAWNKGLAMGGVAKVGQTQLLQAFMTLAASAWLLKETVSQSHIVFATLVVICILASRKSQVLEIKK